MIYFVLALLLVIVYLGWVGWTFVRSGGAVADWSWPLRALAVLWYLVGPSPR